MKTQNITKVFIAVFVLFAITSCLREDDLKKPFVSYKPVKLNDGWDISSPQAEGMNASALQKVYKKFHEDESLWQVRSLLVFRNGKLIAESYTKDDNDRTTPRAIWSCTKQVMGILTGIAIDNQIIDSVDDSLVNYIQATTIFPEKKIISIKDLLTMKSGLDYSNDGLKGQTDDILRQIPENITGFILGRPFAYAPGEKTVYKDCDPQLIASAIQEKVGQKTSEWAKQVLFTPLQIKNLIWDSYKDGTTLGGFGILTTPREMAKFGQLVLDSGQWKGNQLVSKNWIKEMTTVRVNDLFSYQFCYLWWKDPSRQMTFMSGHGGQYVFIIPSKSLIVVMTAEPNTQGNFQFKEKASEFVDQIVKTIN